MDRVREQRIDQARAEIAKRIRRVCGHLPDAELEKLLDRMTMIHCKYDVFPHLDQLAEADELDREIQKEILKFRAS
jgi:hypothetical protein